MIRFISSSIRQNCRISRNAYRLDRRDPDSGIGDCLPVAVASRFIALISKDFRFDRPEDYSLFVCLFLHVVISMISFFFLLLGCSKFRPNFDAIGKNAVSRERESFIKIIYQFKIWNQIWIGSGFQRAIFSLYYLEKKGKRDLKFIATKDCVSYGKFILRSTSQGGKRKELIILFLREKRSKMDGRTFYLFLRNDRSFLRPTFTIAEESIPEESCESKESFTSLMRI